MRSYATFSPPARPALCRTSATSTRPSTARTRARRPTTTARRHPRGRDVHEPHLRGGDTEPQFREDRLRRQLRRAGRLLSDFARAPRGWRARYRRDAATMLLMLFALLPLIETERSPGFSAKVAATFGAAQLARLVLVRAGRRAADESAAA